MPPRGAVPPPPAATIPQHGAFQSPEFHPLNPEIPNFSSISVSSTDLNFAKRREEIFEYLLSSSFAAGYSAARLQQAEPPPGHPTTAPPLHAAAFDPLHAPGAGAAAAARVPTAALPHQYPPPSASPSKGNHGTIDYPACFTQPPQPHPTTTAPDYLLPRHMTSENITQLPYERQYAEQGYLPDSIPAMPHFSSAPSIGASSRNNSNYTLGASAAAGKSGGAKGHGGYVNDYHNQQRKGYDKGKGGKGSRAMDDDHWRIRAPEASPKAPEAAPQKASPK